MMGDYMRLVNLRGLGTLELHETGNCKKATCWLSADFFNYCLTQATCASRLGPGLSCCSWKAHRLRKLRQCGSRGGPGLSCSSPKLSCSHCYSCKLKFRKKQPNLLGPKCENCCEREEKCSKISRYGCLNTWTCLVHDAKIPEVNLPQTSVKYGDCLSRCNQPLRVGQPALQCSAMDCIALRFKEDHVAASDV